MNIRLKLVLSAAALAAGCVLLAGCGGSASSASSSASSAASSGAASQSASEPAASVSAEENGASDAVASAVDALLEADPISNQFEITAMNIEYDFGLKADDVTSYKGLKSNDNGDAGLVLAIQPAAGKAQDVMDTLKTYQQDQVAFYGNYAEFAQAQSNVENAIIDGGDVLGAGIGDGEEPCAAVSCTGLAGRVSKGDEGVDGLSHHIGLHVQNLSELALAHGRRGLHQLR